jgi:hypothetical protein
MDTLIPVTYQRLADKLQSNSSQTPFVFRASSGPSGRAAPSAHYWLILLEPSRVLRSTMTPSFPSMRPQTSPRGYHHCFLPVHCLLRRHHHHQDCTEFRRAARNVTLIVGSVSQVSLSGCLLVFCFLLALRNRNAYFSTPNLLFRLLKFTILHLTMPYRCLSRSY